ncbi:MAG: universal stress protein UspA-like protein [Cyanobacteria bacterium SW_4_48_29]|jgi:nucleotide-binding universal stress UspA family protein|nr:MAG: universal stress protein UspA-like protein [Cyanobacteria bacterium QH_1_48_107]PSO69566.1 MAG: universal stress protein UspA-like protein [Cyanobacteria bacterium QS_1_48_34]PSO86871.1 MAG: universal stress protein UspA-like protein [Cyanobacteria bacterium QS_5_48_63]PSO98613.1 MAG: universal stress protein UspA-like protein [Cyanobacteria bacterium SW_12_48_29]PSP03406.1 MAG: universal stress protein UspA-like protein [Cyanobacteria bacterium SW_7_48_12]PSP21054.1 MAG: universal str
MFQRCLICTDFSDGLHRFVKFVPSLAACGIKQIVFLHSVPLSEKAAVPRADEEKIEQAKARFSEALQGVPEGIEVKIEVPAGRPLETIPRILKDNQTDVVLAGTPIRSLLQEKIFGSTSMGLVKLTQAPIMILRPQLISTYTSEELELRCQHLWRNLLIPYNDSEAARYLIEQIKQYARNRPENSLERCRLCWVVSKGGRQEVITDARLQEAQQKLESVKAELEELDLQVDTEVRQGNPLVEILDVALTFDISAISVGSDSHGTLQDLTVPSFANEVLRQSWFPVLCFSKNQ